MNAYLEYTQWKSGKGKLLNIEEMIDQIKHTPLQNIHIGSDSKITKNNIAYATAVCLLNPGHGGIYFIHLLKDQQVVASEKLIIDWMISTVYNKK